MDMAFVRGDGSSIPISFPCNDDGVACVSALILSIRFNLNLSSLWVEEELFDSDGGQLVSTIMQLKIKSEEGDVWRLPSGKYHAFGTPSIARSVSPNVVTLESVTSTA